MHFPNRFCGNHVFSFAILCSCIVPSRAEGLELFSQLRSQGAVRLTLERNAHVQTAENLADGSFPLLEARSRQQIHNFHF